LLPKHFLQIKNPETIKRLYEDYFYECNDKQLEISKPRKKLYKLGGIK